MGYSIGHRSTSVPILQEQILALLLHHFDEETYKSGRLVPYVNSLTLAVQEVHGQFVHANMFIRAEVLNVVPQEFDESLGDQVRNSGCSPRYLIGCGLKT